MKYLTGEAARDQMEKLNSYLLGGNYAARGIGDSLSFDFGTVLEDPVLQVNIGDSVIKTTYKIILHEELPNRFVNLVLSEKHGQFESLDFYGYIMDERFAHDYHVEGAPLNEFYGAILIVSAEQDPPCPDNRAILMPEEGIIGPHNGTIGGLNLGAPGGFWGDMGGAYTYYYPGGNGNFVPGNGSGDGNGDSGGGDSLPEFVAGIVGAIGGAIGDAGSAVGDAVGDAWGWLTGIFDGGCNGGCNGVNDRPFPGGEGNGQNGIGDFQTGYLVEFTPNGPGGYDNCDPTAVGMLNAKYSPYFIAMKMQVAFEDVMYLMLNDNREFFEDVAYFLELHGFSQASLDYSHQILAQHRAGPETDFSVEFFEFSLAPTELAWWNDPANAVERAEIEGFLEVNGFTIENESFATWAIEAMDNDGIDDGEVDFEELIIIETTFKNNQCLKNVYDKFKQGSNTISQYIANFVPNGSVANLTLNADNNFGANNPNYTSAGAITSAPDNYMITITFNTDPNLASSAGNFPSIILAVEFMHEMIHAEMYRKLLAYAQQPSIPWTYSFINSLRNDFPGLADYYTRWWLNLPPNQPPTSAQHQLMAEHYVDIMADALGDYDNHQHIQSYYEALSWIGLKNTVAWNNLTPDQQANINSQIQNTMQNAPCLTGLKTNST